MHHALGGHIELRTEGADRVIAGRFPYGRQTELAPGRREVIEARAFSPAIDAGDDIRLLAHHNMTTPLASRAAGTLEIRDNDTELSFRATLSAAFSATPYVADFLGALEARLVRGVSPGFRVAPGGERVERSGDGVLRTITQAVLVELSAVTAPAYSDAELSARSWTPTPTTAPPLARRRWRP